jgi:hypothetical protein
MECMSSLSKDPGGGDSLLPSSKSEERGLRKGVFITSLLRLLFFLRTDFVVSADMKTTIPTICSKVQVLSKSRKDKNKVVAFLAVDVIDMVSAPKFLVMAAEQELPKNPILENTNMTKNLPEGLHVLSSRGTFDCCSAYVPGCSMNIRPSLRSPFIVDAALMATRAIEYILKMNSSCPTPN